MLTEELGGYGLKTTYSCNASPNDELRSSSMIGTDSGDLDDDTNDHDSSTKEDRLATTKAVTEGKDEASTKETADSINGDNEALPFTANQDLGKVVGEFRSLDNTGHDTLIVTEKKEISSSDGGDEHLKASARRAPVGGHAISVRRNSHFPELSRQYRKRSSRMWDPGKKAELAELRRDGLGSAQDPFMFSISRGRLVDCNLHSGRAKQPLRRECGWWVYRTHRHFRSQGCREVESTVKQLVP